MATVSHSVLVLLVAVCVTLTAVATVAAAPPAVAAPLLLNFDGHLKQHEEAARGGQDTGSSKFEAYNADWLRYGRQVQPEVTLPEIVAAKRGIRRKLRLLRPNKSNFDDYEWSRFGRKRGAKSADFDDYGFGLKFGRR